jgi:hypothetical protein
MNWKCGLVPDFYGLKDHGPKPPWEEGLRPNLYFPEEHGPKLSWAAWRTMFRERLSQPMKIPFTKKREKHILVMFSDRLGSWEQLFFQG